jgi:hypothetical protein
MANASHNVEQGDTQEDGDEDGGTNECEEASSVNANGKRPPRFIQDKGKKPKTETALIIQEAVTSMANSASSYAAQKEGKFSIDEVMEQVLACGVAYGSNEHFIATELFVNKQHREIFMTMPSIHRFNWLTRKFITNMAIREDHGSAMTCICLFCCFLYSICYLVVLCLVFGC